jgi:hypothetical protein
MDRSIIFISTTLCDMSDVSGRGQSFDFDRDLIREPRMALLQQSSLTDPGTLQPSLWVGGCTLVIKPSSSLFTGAKSASSPAIRSLVTISTRVSVTVIHRDGFDHFTVDLLVTSGPWAANLTWWPLLVGHECHIDATFTTFFMKDAISPSSQDIHRQYW